MCKIRFSLLILIKFDWVSGVNCEISFHSRKTKFVYVERIFGEAVFVQCWFMPKELDACSFPVPRMQTLDLPFDVLGTVLIIYILISINVSVSLLFMDLGLFSVLSDACKSHTYHGYHLARDLGNSNLSGHLVPELGKLEHLQYLELYKNKIQGSIPVELGNLKSLISLDLYNNNISGRIPPSLGNLKSLVFLRLNDNQLNGPIPKSLASISTLKVVDVSNNNLCGPIPTTGSFEHIPLNNFENNPRLEGPELQGLASYDTNCS